jgi:hypothetical protein
MSDDVIIYAIIQSQNYRYPNYEFAFTYVRQYDYKNTESLLLRV